MGSLEVLYTILHLWGTPGSRQNAGKSIAGLLKKNIFSRYGTPRAIISDRGSHLCNNIFSTLLAKYGVKHHKVAMPYHP